MEEMKNRFEGKPYLGYDEIDRYRLKTAEILMFLLVVAGFGYFTWIIDGALKFYLGK